MKRDAVNQIKQMNFIELQSRDLLLPDLNRPPANPAEFINYVYSRKPQRRDIIYGYRALELCLNL